jgi:BRCA1-associated protein
LHFVIQLSEEEITNKTLTDNCVSLEHKLAELNKEKLSVERKCSQLTAQLSKALHDLGEEREMNTCLRRNQTDWQAKVTKLETEIAAKEAVCI